MDKEDAQSPRRIENPRCLWDYVLRVTGLTILGTLLGVLYSAIITTILVRPLLGNFTILLFGLGTFGLLAIAPSAFLLSLPLVFPPASPEKRRIAIALLNLAAGVLGSYLFQSVRPFDVYHELDGNRPAWEPFILFSRITLITVLTSVSVTSTLSRLTRNFT